MNDVMSEIQRLQAKKDFIRKTMERAETDMMSSEDRIRAFQQSEERKQKSLGDYGYDIASLHSIQLSV